jgi:hypothetical protein
LWLVLTAALVLFVSPVAAAPRDAAAQKKIEEAIYTHFLNMDFDTAEGLLVGTFRACEDKCSPTVKGKLWMYVGIIRGSGRQNVSAAEEAFRNAFAEDPNVALDTEIATPEVRSAFERMRSKSGGSGGAAPAPSGGGGGSMTCSLKASEVQSRRPIPIECETDEDLESAKLFYENFNVKRASVKMEQEAGVWRGTIPCSVTQNTGELRYYVEGYDEDDEVVANLGDEDSPEEIQIVAETKQKPPAFPDEDPPARCDISEAGSGGGGGGACAGWGGSCAGGGCCEAGLACRDGICETEECERNSDCGDGECIKGKCKKDKGGGEGAKNYIGAHFGIDWASITSEAACSPDSRTNDSFTCVLPDGTTYESFPHGAPDSAGIIGGGFTVATMRALLSYERLFGSVGVELRTGFAFNGGPNLIPVHAELRGKYWFVGNLSTSGPRLWAHLGGGFAQVDATVAVDVRDCPADPDPNVAPPPGRAPYNQEDCTLSTSSGEYPETDIISLKATKQLGLSFGEVGAGFMYAAGENHGPVLNVNFMVMFPAFGLVLQPTVGYAVGF